MSSVEEGRKRTKKGTERPTLERDKRVGGEKTIDVSPKDAQYANNTAAAVGKELI